MSKEQHGNRENKKKALKTMKEKRADKRSKGQDSSPLLNIGKGKKA
ncbi:MAG: hypothetical protein U5O39_06295 [Gammaproteobacteria bacterium]|nr:hypothetical protein [Gammaproteobacteria bacterium]